LFAYSGHGIPRANAATGSLELANAKSSEDFPNLFEFDELRVLLEDLAAKSYHVLALINACYGGGIFASEIAGEVLNNPYGKGAHAMTAGPSDSLVYALPGKNKDTGEPHGSIFFENLIRGVSSGDADQDSRNYPSILGPDGEVRQSGAGIVRLGALDTWLAGQIDQVNDQTGGNPDTHKRFSYPVLGSVEPFDVTDPGAFFFLQPQKPQSLALDVARPQGRECRANDQGGPCACDANGRCVGTCDNGACVAPPIVLPRNPTSFVSGKPELKVFKAPSTYPIRGVDVSRFEGDIDWSRLKDDRLDFVYVRALAKGLDTQATADGVDRRFSDSWEKARASGMYRGAYNVFSYCDAVATQYDLISRTVPVDKDALPIAIDIERYPASWNSWNREAQCAAATNNEDLRRKILELASLLQNRYGKTPLIQGVGSVLSSLLNESFSKYMIWIASYPRDASVSSPDLKLSGGNPWTLWQYTANSTVPGIGDNVDSNVFFGTADQFIDFRNGKYNVALKASLFAGECKGKEDDGKFCSCDSHGENCGTCKNGSCVPPVQ